MHTASSWGLYSVYLGIDLQFLSLLSESIFTLCSKKVLEIKCTIKSIKPSWWIKHTVRNTNGNISPKLYFNILFRFAHIIVNLPKSANLSSPISLMSKFCGLTSRCNILLRWQYESPRKSWNMKSFTFRGFKPPGWDSRYWDKSVCWK